MIKRWFRSLKEACVWQQQFRTFHEVLKAISAWIQWYNTERPHQALGYRSPQAYHRMHIDVPPDPATQCLRAA
jgi:putative transposase